MKLLLVGIYDTDTVSLAPQVLRAFLKASADMSELEVVTMEFSIFTGNARDMSEAIAGQSADVVGFSAYIWNIGLIRRIAPGLASMVLVGGPQVTGVEGELLEDGSGVDAVVTGEGEQALLEIMRALLAGRDLSGIPGVSTRLGSTPPSAASMDLSTTPRFYEDLFSRHPGLGWISLETSRGCSFGCRYCTWATSRKMRYLPLDRVLADLDVILAQSGISNIYFCDSNILFNKGRAKAILEHIVAARADKAIRFEFNAEHLDDEIIALMAQLPRMEFNFGLQTVNPRALESVGRAFNRSRFEENYRKVADRVGESAITLDLIYGLPGDDFQGYKASVGYALGLGRPKRILTNPLILLPGSEFYRNREVYGISLVDRQSYLVDHTASFSAADMELARRLSLYLAILFLNDALRDAVRDLARERGQDMADLIMNFFGGLSFLLDEQSPDMIPTVARDFKRRNQVMGRVIDRFDDIVARFEDYSGQPRPELALAYPGAYTEQYRKMKRFIA